LAIGNKQDHAVTKPQPRYQKISEELLGDISAGKFPVGSMLPTELELCERFTVSRFTVRG
jgi:DNA-binding GntR family transcriptional regulator